MLGTAQSFGLLGTKGRRQGAIRPGQPSFRGLVDRSEPWWRNGKNAAFSFNQDIARIGGGGRDEGNPAGLSGCRLLTHPFCQRARLSKTPASEQQPDLPPTARWRQLVWARHRRPGSFQRIGELCSEGTSHRPQLPRCGDPSVPVPKRLSHRDHAVPQLRRLVPPGMAPPHSRSGRSFSHNRD